MWLSLVALALFAVGGLCFVAVYRHQETVNLQHQATVDHLRAELSTVVESCRRLDIRLDNINRQHAAMAEQLGWADEHARTRLLTGKMPLPR